MSSKDIEKTWTKVAVKQLKGRTIVDVRYMTEEEANNIGWFYRPIVLILDDGNYIFPSKDDEGNNAGALFTGNKDEDVIPVI